MPADLRRATAKLALELMTAAGLLLLSAPVATASFFTTTEAITASDPTQSERPTRDTIQDTCQSSDFDGTSGFGLVFHYDLYAFTNRSENALCVRVALMLQPPCALDNVHSAAYAPSFLPGVIATNFVGSGDAGVWSFNVPAHAPFVLNVHETMPGLGCSSYSLDLNADRHFNLSQPAISGTPVVGATLTADTGTWAGADGGTPPSEFAYQWRRCSAAGADCADIGGPGPSYQVTAADVGSALQVLVIAGAAGPAQNSAASALAGPIAGPAAVAAPVALPALAPPRRVADRADFTSSPKVLRVSSRGRFTYSFAATPGRAGQAELTSTRAVRIGAVSRRLRIGPTSFVVPATGEVALRLKLTRSALRGLGRSTSVAFKVDVTIGTGRFTTKLQLRPHGARTRR